MRYTGTLFQTVFLALLVSCSSESSVNLSASNAVSRDPETKTTTQTNGASADSSGCDASLWDRVYNPSRLEVIAPCKVVTGVIEELDQNEDGDTHMLLKLDSGADELLLKKNKTKKQGDLVVEIVCANAVTVKKAAETCTGYTNKITIPSIGDHVKVTGSYVNDSHNDWAEIHPVSKIEKL